MATLEQILKDQIASDQRDRLDRGRVGTLPAETPVLDSLRGRGQLPTLQQTLGTTGIQGTYTPPAPLVNPALAPSANVLSRVIEGLERPAAQAPVAAPAPDTTPTTSQVARPVSAQPSARGVRTPRGAQPVLRSEAPAPVAPAMTGADNIAAYMERTGTAQVPRAPLEIISEAGRVNPVNPAQEAAFEAFLASPEGQAEQARQAALPNANLVEVVRGDKTTFENVGPGGNTGALRDYLFSQQQAAQQQRDYLSAVSKPVGAPLSLGEAEALKLGDRAMQEKGDLAVAGINAGAQIGSARINAAAGKNPLYDAAVADINATTDPAAKATKIQQYLGGGARPAAKANDPLAETYLELASMQSPEFQRDFSQGIAMGVPAAQVYADVLKKYGKGGR